METLAKFVDSLEEAIRFLLPGGYFLLLAVDLGFVRAPISDELHVTLVILCVGPLAYLIYRQLWCLADDAILKYHAHGESIASYKNRLYRKIQGTDEKFQGYVYFKFASCHASLLVSSVTIVASIYAVHGVCCCSFVARNSCLVLWFSTIVFLVGIWNWWQLHSVQHEYLRNGKSAEHDTTAHPR